MVNGMGLCAGERGSDMTRMLQLEPAMQRAVESAILVSGGGRSGTTVLGKLIHSFSDVEYVFEPPTLIALFALFDTLPESAWRFLYEAYLGEDFLANALAGRAINTNRADDSSVLAVKTAQDIERRLARSWGKQDLMQAAAHSVIAYKIPNIVPMLARFHVRYPASRVVVIKRGAAESIQSLMQKGWFRDLGPGSTLHWPFREQAGVRVPYWVAPGDETLWCELAEVDRCAYYYLRMSDAPPEGDRVLHVRYAALVSRPAETAQRLACWLGLTPGARTAEVLAAIAPTGKPVDGTIIDRVSLQFRDEVLRQSALSE